MIGFTCGTYDLFHAGHVLALKECKEYLLHRSPDPQYAKLIVGLQYDPTIDRHWKNKPIQSMHERRIQLAGCKYVDEIWEYETEAQLFDYLAKAAKEKTIDVRFLGADWKDKRFTGDSIQDIKIVFNSRDHNYSSTDLRNRIIKANS